MSRAITLPPTSTQNAIGNPSIWDGNMARRDATVTPVCDGSEKLANTRTNALVIANEQCEREQQILDYGDYRHRRQFANKGNHPPRRAIKDLKPPGLVHNVSLAISSPGSRAQCPYSRYLSRICGRPQMSGIQASPIPTRCQA